MILVRLLAETWIEIYVFAVYFISSFSSSLCGGVSWNSGLLEIIILQIGSSPCGDVSWNLSMNNKLPYVLRSSPCGDASWNDDIKWNTTDEYRFVSLLGCELKYDEYVPRTRIWSSSPCGDVNWNFNCLWGSKCRCRYGSSPKGDVIWNIFSGANSLGFFCSSPRGDMSWNDIHVLTL